MKRRGNVISPIDTVNTLVEMLIQTDSSVEDGETVWVRSTQAMYVYRINSGLTPDGVNVIASLYGLGLWQKLNVGTVGPGSALGPFNTVAVGAAGSGRLLDVTAAQVAGLSNGTPVWVQSVRSSWVWEASSTATADNITICNPTANGVNPGRFVRDLSKTLNWYQTTAWTMNVNDAAGNDEWDGSAATNTPGTLVGPVKNHAEIARRLGDVITPEAPLTVQQTGDAATQNAKYTNIVVGPSGAFLLTAVLPTPAFTGTISAKTDQVSTATPATTTLNAAVSTWTPATEVGRLVFDATNQGYAWGDADLGGGNLQLSPWSPAQALTNIINAWTAFNGAVNDVVSTYVLPLIGGIEAGAPAHGVNNAAAPAIIVSNFNIQATVGITRFQCFNSMQVVNCQFTGSLTAVCGGSVRLVNCQFLAGGTMGNDSPTMHYFFAGRSRGGSWTLTRNSYAQLQQDVLFNNTTFNASNGSFLGVLGGIWTRTANPLAVTNGACLRVDAPSINGGGLLSSTSVAANANTGVGVLFRRTGRLALQTSGRVTLTGANDFSVGGLTTALAFDPTLALYNTTPRACTWVLLLTTFAGGGFESCLTDPRTGCLLAVAA